MFFELSVASNPELNCSICFFLCAASNWTYVKKDYTNFVFRTYGDYIWKSWICIAVYVKRSFLWPPIALLHIYCPGVDYLSNIHYCLLFRFWDLWVPEATGSHDSEKGDQTERWGNKKISGDFPFLFLAGLLCLLIAVYSPLNLLFFFTLYTFFKHAYSVYEWT